MFFNRIIMGLVAFFYSATAAFWLALWFYNPYTLQSYTELITAPGFFMILLSLLGVWAALNIKPVSLFFIALFSLIPIGSYMLSSPGIFMLIGWFNLACFILILIYYCELLFLKLKGLTCSG